MKKQPVIKSVESKISIPEPALVTAVTKWKKDDNSFTEKENSFLPQGYEKFTWSSAFSRISGNTEIAFITGPDEKINYLNIPFTSWFLFTCTKNKEQEYKIGWGISLS